MDTYQNQYPARDGWREGFSSWCSKHTGKCFFFHQYQSFTNNINVPHFYVDIYCSPFCNICFSFVYSSMKSCGILRSFRSAQSSSCLLNELWRCAVVEKLQHKHNLYSVIVLVTFITLGSESGGQCLARYLAKVLFWFVIHDKTKVAFEDVCR